MRYEIKDRSGEIIYIDTRNIDYNSVWETMGLSQRNRRMADRVIEPFNSADFDEILIVDSHSWMRPHNREEQRHQADHYRTRTELEKTAKNNKLVRKLIHYDILELHPEWWFLKTKKEEEGKIVIGPGHIRHPQAPYRLNVWNLHELESASMGESYVQ